MKHELDTSIGLRIREVRERLGYTRELLAEKSNIATSFLADIELGNKGLSVTTLIKICKVLNISADYILFGKENNLEYMKVAGLLSGLDKKYLPYIESIIGSYIKTIVLAQNNS